MKSELVLQTTKKTGFLKRDICLICFFKDEILITTLNKEKQKELFMNKKQEEKLAGGGFIKQTIAMQTAITDYVDMIKNMEKSSLLKETTEAIKKEMISNIQFKKASRHEDYETNVSSVSEGKLILTVNNNKLKFKHLYEDKTKEIKNYLNDYLN